MAAEVIKRTPGGGPKPQSWTTWTSARREPTMTAALVSVVTIKRTMLANDIVVETIRRSDPHLIRPFQTFVVTPTTRYAQRLTDYTCAATALHAHEVLARDLMKARGS